MPRGSVTQAMHQRGTHAEQTGFLHGFLVDHVVQFLDCAAESGRYSRVTPPCSCVSFKRSDRILRQVLDDDL